MRFLILILLLPFLLFSGEPTKEKDPVPLPMSLLQVDNTYRLAGAKLRAKYLEDLQKIQIPVVREYDKAIDEATKKKDLDLAIALRDKKKEFIETEAVMNDTVGNFYTPRDRIEGERGFSLSRFYEKKWIAFYNGGAKKGATYTFDKDGSFTNTEPSSDWNKGTWKLEKEVLTVTFQNKKIWITTWKEKKWEETDKGWGFELAE